MASTQDTSTANQDSASPIIFARHYLLQRAITTGSSFAVWRAMDQRTGESVAVKFFPPELLRTSMDMLAVREVLTPVRNHPDPRVVPAHQIATDARYSAVVTPWIDGASLATLRRARPQERFDPADIEPWLRTLIDVFEHAHASALVHGAFSPEQALVQRDGSVVVLGFGIDAWLHLALNAIGGRSRSLSPYLSPAMRDGAPPRVADDVYAFGAVGYALLAGAPPSVGRHWWSRSAPASVSARRKRGKAGDPLPPAWDDVILGCLHPDEDQRLVDFTEIRLRLRWSGPAPVPPATGRRSPAPAPNTWKQDLSPAHPLPGAARAAVEPTNPMTPRETTPSVTMSSLHDAASSPAAESPPSIPTLATAPPTTDRSSTPATPESVNSSRSTETPSAAIQVIGPQQAPAPVAVSSAQPTPLFPDIPISTSGTTQWERSSRVAATTAASAPIPDPRPVSASDSTTDPNSLRASASVPAVDPTAVLPHAPPGPATAVASPAGRAPSNHLSAPAPTPPGSSERQAPAKVNTSGESQLPGEAGLKTGHAATVPTPTPILPPRPPVRYSPIESPPPKWGRQEEEEEERAATSGHHPIGTWILKFLLYCTALATITIGGLWGWRLYEVRQEFVALWREVQALPADATESRRAELEARLVAARARLSDRQWQTLREAWATYAATKPGTDVSKAPAPDHTPQ